MTKSEMIYTDFMKDVETYIRSRLPDVPDHEILEISAYVTARTAVMANDLIRNECNRLADDIHETYRKKRSVYNKKEWEENE